MQLYEVILIGIALAMDACALTIANCVTYKNSITAKKEWAMPVAFALFQGIMPLLGYYIGSLFSDYIGKASGYVTATIFFILAVKIVVDIFKDKKEECSIKDGKKTCYKTEFTYGVLILQAVATSIDALAVGVTLVNITFSIFVAVATISAVTFLLVFACLFLGKKLGTVFGEYAEWIGAGILFVLSIKSFVEALI